MCWTKWRILTWFFCIFLISSAIFCFSFRSFEQVLFTKKISTCFSCQFVVQHLNWIHEQLPGAEPPFIFPSEFHQVSIGKYTCVFQIPKWYQNSHFITTYVVFFCSQNLYRDGLMSWNVAFDVIHDELICLLSSQAEDHEYFAISLLLMI